LPSTMLMSTRAKESIVGLGSEESFGMQQTGTDAFNILRCV